MTFVIFLIFPLSLANFVFNYLINLFHVPLSLEIKKGVSQYTRGHPSTSDVDTVGPISRLSASKFEQINSILNKLGRKKIISTYNCKYCPQRYLIEHELERSVQGFVGHGGYRS